MSPRKRNLSCPEEQLKPFFPEGTIISLGEKELKFPQGTNEFKKKKKLTFAYEF
jgi:hypothetical protein